MPCAEDKTTTASPCVLCGTTGGDFSANSHRPARVSLFAFGVDGAACMACYARSRYRRRHGLNIVGPLRRGVAHA